MVKITKKEAEYLNKKCGIVYGENGISVPPSSNGSYLCETRYNINALNKYRKGQR